MGELIHFTPKRYDNADKLYQEAETDVRRVSLKAQLRVLKQQENHIEAIISERCKKEIAELNILDEEIKKIEAELNECYS